MQLWKHLKELQKKKQSRSIRRCRYLLGGGELGAAPGIRIIPEQFGIKILTMPVGGFLTLGALIAAMQWAMNKAKNKKKEAK